VAKGKQAGVPATTTDKVSKALELAPPAMIAEYDFNDTSVLAAIQENLGGAGLSPSDLERIKFPSGGAQFWEIPTLDGETEPVKAVEGIILHNRNERVYWADEFTGAGTPPDCSSKDCIRGIGTPGGSCLTCPYAQWGSDPKGGDGQACKQIGVQVILRPGESLPMVVQIPPASLDPMKKFMVKLAAKKMAYRDCIVSLNLEKAQNKAGISYSKVKPKILGVLPPEARAKIAVYAESLKSVFKMISVSNADLAGSPSDE